MSICGPKDGIFVCPWLWQGVGVRQEIRKRVFLSHAHPGALPFSEIYEPSGDWRCCANCDTTLPKMKKCGGCRLVHYCGSLCQKAHWKAHKKECNADGALPSKRFYIKEFMSDWKEPTAETRKRKAGSPLPLLVRHCRCPIAKSKAQSAKDVDLSCCGAACGSDTM